MTTLGPMPDSSPLPPDIAAIRRRLVDRFDDLRWCNKDDECHTGAEWLSLAISDLDAEVRDLRAALAATPDTLDVERLARAMHEARKVGGPWSPCVTRDASGDMVPVGFDEDPNGDFACLCTSMAAHIAAESARLREDRS